MQSYFSELFKVICVLGYKAGDVAVLTPYLGQLIKLRNELRTCFTVSLDERDADEVALALGEDALEEHKTASTGVDETDTEPRNITTALKKPLNDQVTLRTIDNFQGEEAKIVIISLVRNICDTSVYRGTSIGFLKSDNRTNVLLSRAMHGMYMLGNADLLGERLKLWKQVIDILKTRDCVGNGFPTRCQNHEKSNLIATPEAFESIVPDGGCLLPCSHKLYRCGEWAAHEILSISR